MTVAIHSATLPKRFFEAVEETEASLSDHILWVRVHMQQLFLFELARLDPPQLRVNRNFVISTSRFGIGQQSGSNKTPLGLHRVAEKIGHRWPAGTVFKAREPIGFTWAGFPNAKITTRILWLEGLEPGLNRNGEVDSRARYIYIHGTADQSSIGKPASCGCIHVADRDLIPLFQQLSLGTLVFIEE